MGDEREMSMAIPLDDEGFLLRECPTCEREFKWLASSDGAESEPVPDGGYYCPYCGIQAPEDAWWTTEQLAAAENKMMRDVVGPELKRFQRDLGKLGRSSGGLVSFKPGRIDLPSEANPLVDSSDDMERVDFGCHPKEPVKVLSSWSQDLYCLICGTRTPFPH
jgi:hypothetical protein